MNINLNIPVRLVVRLVRSIEKLADAYVKVHAYELQAFDYQPQKEEKIGHTYYQDDKEIFKAELEAKLRAEGLF